MVCHTANHFLLENIPVPAVLLHVVIANPNFVDTFANANSF